MATRFDRFFQNQMEDPEMRELVEKELASLQIAAQITKLRAKRHMNQTQLAARAKMSAPKVSKLESKPTNVQLDTLIKVAEALGARLEVRFVEDKRRRAAASA